MPLQDFLDYVANHPDEPLTWELGGRAGTYVGRLVIETRTSTCARIGKYRDLMLVGEQFIEGAEPRQIIVGVCGADNDGVFSKNNTIKNNKIVKAA
jgi:hypothetical protein